jgi:hypothetical protein
LSWLDGQAQALLQEKAKLQEAVEKYRPVSERSIQLLLTALNMYAFRTILAFDTGISTQLTFQTRFQVCKKSSQYTEPQRSEQMQGEALG